MTELASTYLILWASQTGNAEWIAKNIHTEATKKGYTGDCFVMDDYEKVNKAYTIHNENLIVIDRHHFKKQESSF